MIVMKTTNEVVFGVGDVHEGVSGRSVMRTQRRSPAKASGYACGKATQR